MSNARYRVLCIDNDPNLSFLCEKTLVGDIPRIGEVLIFRNMKYNTYSDFFKVEKVFYSENPVSKMMEAIVCCIFCKTTKNDSSSLFDLNTNPQPKTE